MARSLTFHAQATKRISKAKSAARSVHASLKALESEHERLQKQDFEAEAQNFEHEAEATADKVAYTHTFCLLNRT